ncbi:MAG: T9SS type A sorting domain-containing protein [Melioribacteraceae bacterium]|nr:T9SS type A sorting domain-containing protein [Melioribacteraceae bacterium]MCF8356012.1 T9SS type A sorting domain-containing protein [Melioribacteraceae bacterium]MCF8394677.1 T9SS type A sorting domain-containing protein [Melioribacteraceae bacterium]MCF8420245.1 T9SS type A sorting domain-containing protein [Melioribacteraceae bacterium]
MTSIIKCFLSLFLITSISLFGQFEQTNGPAGISFSSVTTVGDTIYGLTSHNYLFSYANNEWERISADVFSYQIASYNGRIYSLGQTIQYYNEDTNDWLDMLDGYFGGYSIYPDRFFVIMSDTIYHSYDGFSWAQTFDSLKSTVDVFGDTVSQRLISIKSVANIDSNYVIACIGEISMTQNGIYVSKNGGKDWFEPEGLESFSNVSKIVTYNNKFYLTSSYGLYVSADSGSTWQLHEDGFTFETSNYISNLIAHNGNLYALQNNPRVVFRLEDDVWQPLDIPIEIGSITGFKNGKLLLYSTNQLHVFDLATGEIENITSEIVAANSFVFAFNNETAIAYAASAGTQITTDGGISWNEFPDRIIKLTKIDHELFYTNSSGVFRTSDLGLTISNINSNLPTNYVNSASAICSSDGTVYVSFSRSRPRTHLPPVWEAGGVYKSTNDGETWTLASSGLPASGGIRVPVYDLIAGNDMLVASTAEGTYRSTNGGGSWALFETGFGEYTKPIYYGGLNDTIFISTYFEGIMMTSPDMDEWQIVSDGLDSVFNGYNYRFIQENGKMYMYDNENRSFYRFDNGTWVHVELTLPGEFEVYRFSGASEIIYASVFDGGVWKGKIENPTTVNEETTVNEFELSQNYPNPFNPTTVIDYKIAHSTNVKIIIYNSLGETAATLVDDFRQAGKYSVTWNAHQFASGVYFYKLVAGDYKAVKKLLLLK